MSEIERNKEVVRRAISAFNAQDLDLYFSYHTQDYTSHEVFFPEPLTYEQCRDFIPRYWRAYPDAFVDTQNMIAEGNLVVVENIMSGTFLNDLGENKATGKSFKVPEACFFELENGKIKAARVFTDQKEMEKQLELAQ